MAWLPDVHAVLVEISRPRMLKNKLVLTAAVWLIIRM